MTLLDEVRADLAGTPTDDLLPELRRGHGFEAISIDDAAVLSDSAAIASVRLVDDRRLLVPLVRDSEWRRAQPADRISMQPLSAPAPLVVRRTSEVTEVDPQRERDLAVDMSNDVRVVDDAVVAKWQLFGEAGSLAGPRVVEHLAAAGFAEMPEPIATVTWHEELLVSYTRFLPGAEDGWDWMLRDVQQWAQGDAARPSWAGELGALTARMHAAATQPTDVIEDPVSRVDLRPLAAHYQRLIDAAEGLDAEMFDALMPSLVRFDEACEILRHDVTGIPIHGDLHAGQFLRWSHGIVVNDFDGNPLMTPEQRGAPGPTALDVAGLLRSLDHVAIAAARRIDDPAALAATRAWAREARDEALSAYLATHGVPALDADVLEAFESLSPLHEAVYAATYLPRWRYVPLAVLGGGW